MSKPLFVVTIITGISFRNFFKSSTLSEVIFLYGVSTLPNSLTFFALSVILFPVLSVLDLLLLKFVPAVNVMSFPVSILPVSFNALFDTISAFPLTFKPSNFKPPLAALLNLTFSPPFIVAALIKLLALSKVISLVAVTSILFALINLSSACAIEPSELALNVVPITSPNVNMPAFTPLT